MKKYYQIWTIVNYFKNESTSMVKLRLIILVKIWNRKSDIQQKVKTKLLEEKSTHENDFGKLSI